MEIKIKCENCGKEAPKIEENSNNNWVAFKTDQPCECGGKFTPSLEG